VIGISLVLGFWCLEFMAGSINASTIHVVHPPARPLLIWDGECHFCRRWIERWRVITRGEVDYAPFQEIGERCPEIPRDRLQRSIVYIDKSGEVFFAAEAAYRSLQCRYSRRWLAWSYDRLPGFAAISEFGYGLIARHRAAASLVTRLLWGEDVRPPTYYQGRRWFLRALGLIYLIAFLSLWIQIGGLIGENGILPVHDFLSAVRKELGSRSFAILPTLCWFNSSNAFLHFLCSSGVLFSLLLVFEIAPTICLFSLFVFYLSLTLAGQTFLSFQWDILLLETGFLSIFLAPWRIWPDKSMLWPGSRIPATPVSRPALFLLKLLLFKLMVMSGVVKLTSGDDSWGWVDHSLRWSAMTALDYHYWSQPLPTIFAWYADKTPEWFKHFSVAVCLFVEIIVPIFIWAPRRLRLAACGLLVLLQVAIAITGNYCFFNLLSIALCLLLIDDATVSPCRGSRSLPQRASAVTDRRYSDQLSILAAEIVIIMTLPLNAWLIFNAFKPEAEMPRVLGMVYERIEPFRIVNGYGLFRVMTKDRGEIVIEGSPDGVDWLPYEFRWKPGDPMRAPQWCAPHQPRLDWQMWFAALGSPRQSPWFFRLERCLLEGKSDVSGLLKTNPFPKTPPRYIRAIFYRYRFTTLEQHRRTGAWWKRQELGEYFPSFSLEDLR
jgi:predicted DCC family thiol-disulfide oxidoreductase YuxK